MNQIGFQVFPFIGPLFTSLHNRRLILSTWFIWGQALILSPFTKTSAWESNHCFQAFTIFKFLFSLKVGNRTVSS